MKVLICGLGRMGKIHKKYVEQLDVPWVFYDPYIDNATAKNQITSLTDIDSVGVTHVIVSSNEDRHYQNYLDIRAGGFSGPIMVEKPAVTQKKDFAIFNDKLLTVGMVERFNPSIEVLKSNLVAEDVVSVDFVRCSVSSSANKRVNSFVDVGIHDIDLYFHLFGKNIKFHNFSSYSNTYTLSLKDVNGFISRFIWSNETSCKERNITIRHKNFTLEADLIDQTVTKTSTTSDGKMLTQNLYVEKASPILRQLQSFLNNQVSGDCKESHDFYLFLREEQNV